MNGKSCTHHEEFVSRYTHRESSDIRSLASSEGKILLDFMAKIGLIQNIPH
jgi:hypothetical protein